MLELIDIIINLYFITILLSNSQRNAGTNVGTNAEVYGNKVIMQFYRQLVKQCM